MRRISRPIAMAAAVGVGAVFIALIGWSMLSSRSMAKVGGGEHIIVYKDPTCSCCGGWIAYLRKEGFDVEVKETADMGAIKAKFGVPNDAQSCHTAVLNGKVIEGHVPAEAIKKFTDEAPSSVRGIALPGMPAGSPGMPGVKGGAWDILAMNTDGSLSSFMVQ